MPDMADLPEVLHVLDVLLRRLSDGERLPPALVKLETRTRTNTIPYGIEASAAG